MSAKYRLLVGKVSVCCRVMRPGMPYAQSSGWSGSALDECNVPGGQHEAARFYRAMAAVVGVGE